MRADPEKVAAILGDERLELLYLGSEHLASDSSAAVRREVQSAQFGLGERDVVADGIYRNLQHILRCLKEHPNQSIEDLAAQLRNPQLEYNGLEAKYRSYINGCAGVDDGISADSSSGGNDTVDRSLKGSVDVMLVPLLRLLLRTGRFVSTSCCSGRVAIFECNAEHATAATKRASDFGRAGRFLYTSHCHLNHQEALAAASAVNADVKCKRDCYRKDLSTYNENEEPQSSSEPASSEVSNRHPCEVLLKFEAFVLHVECASMQDATTLLQLVRGCGLKKSGIITCTKRIIVSVTGSNILETPIAIRHYIRGNYKSSTEQSDHGGDVNGPDTTSQAQSTAVERNERVETQWLVSQDQFMYLLATCNKKLTGSIRQMLRLYWSCVNQFGIDILQPFAILGNRFVNGSKDGASSAERRGDIKNKGRRRLTVHNNMQHTDSATSVLNGEMAGSDFVPTVMERQPNQNVLGVNAPREGVAKTPLYICTWFSPSPDEAAGPYKSMPRPYVAVKIAQYIKPLKSRLEQHRLYDKTRKILTNISVTIPDTETCSSNVNNEASTLPSQDNNGVTYADDTRKKFAVPAFIPIVEVTDEELTSVLSQSDSLLDFVIAVNGTLKCRITTTKAAIVDKK
ncbi:kelch repeat-containing protein, putative [Babesia ovata]|uniref:tRNA(Phe) 7-[(3-amino-3-carboxypropyl)-4-demethylwyosine(37)-N(4)]-methyltransferase n=1 Tax=Babesia ovata TaxID=189622 RepID=A0A2H6KCX6_9APIC|nr:kelch repeat-containing protein, putative [Babesia ovata]GBE60837.1 kelch repeat-containing protein, putative [Babesia ovata]